MLPDLFLRQILDNLTTAVLLLDADLQVNYMNPAAEMLLEVSGQRVTGQRLDSLFSDSVESLQPLRNTVATGHPFTKREAQLNLSNGQALIADYSVTPVSALERSWVLLELLPRVRLLRITREEAQLSKQEVTRILMRGLAHEIKNPLGGIRGAAQLLARELPQPELQDYTDVIIQEADRLRNLVDRMLGPYRPPQLSRINIHEITERVCSLVEAETQGDLQLLRDYDPSIPDLMGDREQLIQAASRLRDLFVRVLGPYRPPQLSRINIHEITERVCSLVEAVAQGDLQLLRDYDPSIPDLMGDREQLIQAVLNIGRNAMQALL